MASNPVTVAPTAPLSAELRNCVVCGLGSHRTDWVRRAKVGNVLYVACDSHTDQELMAAVNAATVKAKKEAEAAKAPAAAATEPSDALRQAAADAATAKK